MKKFIIDITKGTRSCLGCGRKIEKNTTCLTFKYGSSYYSVSANLCRVCILNMQEDMYHLDLEIAKNSAIKKLKRTVNKSCIKS